MKTKAVILIVAGIIIVSAMQANAQQSGVWRPPTGTPPSDNSLGPVWLQSGSELQTGNAALNGDLYIADGKAIRIDKANGASTMIISNFSPTNPTGFTLDIRGDLTVSGLGGGDTGTLNIKRICLTQDPPGGPATCRTTWPTGAAVSDIWVDTTGDTMTGQLIINKDVSAQGAIKTTNNAAVGYGGDFTGTAGGIKASGQTGGYFEGTLYNGITASGSQIAVYGRNGNASGEGVRGEVSGPGSFGVYGLSTYNGTTGVYGNANGAGGKGVEGNTIGTGSYAVYGQSTGPNSYGGYFTGTSYGVTGVNSAGSAGTLGWGDAGVYGNGATYGVYGGSPQIGVFGDGYYGVYGYGSERGVYGYGGTYGVYGTTSADPTKWGALGYPGYGVYSSSNIYSQGAKGVVLDALDRPLITRGHDPFTSGIYSGVGRWGLFMEPSYLTLGIPNLGNKGVKISKYNDDSITKTDLMTVTDAGFVGIGTSVPTARLHAIDNAASPLVRLQNNSASGWSSIDFLNNSGALSAFAGWGNGSVANFPNMAYFGTAGAYPTALVTGGVQRLYINSSGNVGIGTTSPADKLHVAGDIRVGTGTTGCVKDADGTVLTGACVSDARLKSDIQTLDVDALDVITGLRPVTFRWNSLVEGSTDDLQLGVIAQDVEKVAPSLVEVDDQGYKRVHFEELPFYLIKAVQELKAENDELRARVEALEKK